MDKATLKALNGSIAKWQGIVAGRRIDHGTENCPLCKKFYNHKSGLYMNDCTGCPVKTRTNLRHCNGSPYEDWSNTDAHNLEQKVSSDDERKIAQAELDFLISLRPTKAV